MKKTHGFLLPVFVFLLFVSGITQAAPLASARVLDYSLEVALDTHASKINGTVRIPVNKDQELRLSKGRLKVLQVTLDHQEIAILDDDETFRILPPREGVAEIKYEGVFDELPRFLSPGPSSTISPDGIFLIGDMVSETRTNGHLSSHGHVPPGI